MKEITILTLFLLLFSLPVLAKEKLTGEQIDQINYSLGHQLGVKLGEVGSEFRVEAFLAGIYEAIEKLEPRLDEKSRSELLKAKTVPQAQIDDLNYSYGYQVGTRLVKAGIDVLPDALAEGVFDRLERLEPRLGESEMDQMRSLLEAK